MFVINVIIALVKEVFGFKHDFSNFSFCWQLSALLLSGLQLKSKG